MSNLETRPPEVLAGEPPIASREVGWTAAEVLHARDVPLGGARAMRVHRTILPKVTFQIENLINLDQIPPRVKVIALPAKWKTESAPARVIALVDEPDPGR